MDDVIFVIIIIIIIVVVAAAVVVVVVVVVVVAITIIKDIYIVQVRRSHKCAMSTGFHFIFANSDQE